LAKHNYCDIFGAIDGKKVLSSVPVEIPCHEPCQKNAHSVGSMALKVSVARPQIHGHVARIEVLQSQIHLSIRIEISGGEVVRAYSSLERSAEHKGAILAKAHEHPPWLPYPIHSSIREEQVVDPIGIRIRNFDFAVHFWQHQRQ